MRLSKARRACVEAMMKDAIFDAATAVLEERGTDGLTMDRVATRVGVAPASLYNYFRDKDDLLQFFYTRMADPFFQAIQEIPEADMLAPQKLARILQEALELAVKHKGIVKLLAGMGYDSEIRKASRPRFMQILKTIFEQGIKEGSFRPLDTMDMSRMFVACLSELFDLQCGGASESDVKRFGGALIDATLNGIHAKKSPAAGEPC